MRIANQEDHRIINLGLTSKGRLLYRAHDAFHKLLVQRFLKGFDNDEIHLIKQAMVNLEEFIDEVSAK